MSVRLLKRGIILNMDNIRRFDNFQHTFSFTSHTEQFDCSSIDF